MANRIYVWIENGIWIDGFREYPLTSCDGLNIKTVNYQGWAYITQNTMRINPSGEPFGAIYDFEVGPCTPESLVIANDYESGIETGKRHRRRIWPMDASDAFKQGYRRAWEDKGKPFDDRYWRQYWRNR